MPPWETEVVDTSSVDGRCGGSPDTDTPAQHRSRPTPGINHDRPARRRVAFVAAALFAVVTMAMWMWMLFVYDPGLMIDELPDRTFPTEAEKICAATNEAISDLPPAETTDDPIERAGVIDTANTDLATMLVRLAPLAPTEPPESAEAVQEWLDDWATHLEDRQRYADSLRSDPTARFTETAKGSKQVSRAIDSFAEVNRMPSCGTPGDV